MDSVVIRPLRAEETPLLEDFLYEAIWQPDPGRRVSREVLHAPELRIRGAAACGGSDGPGRQFPNWPWPFTRTAAGGASGRDWCRLCWMNCAAGALRRYRSPCSGPIRPEDSTSVSGSGLSGNTPGSGSCVANCGKDGAFQFPFGFGGYLRGGSGPISGTALLEKIGLL